MSTTAYKRIPSQLHLFYCEWQVKGETHKHTFKYTGDVVDAYMACRETVIWAKHPTFKITKLISKEA